MEALGLIVVLILWVAFRFASLALVMWFDAYYPDLASRIHATYTDRGRRCVLIGLFNLLAWPLVAALLISTQVLALFGLAVLTCLIGAAIIGYAPAYRELGDRLDGGSDRMRNRNLIRGFICLEAAFMTPLIGQAMAFGVLVRGLGAVVTTMLSSRRRESPPSLADTDSMPPSEADATT